MKVYNDLSASLNFANRYYLKEDKALARRIQTSQNTAVRAACQLAAYPDCGVLNAYNCPPGVYSIFHASAARPRLTFCQKGSQYKADGCAEGWRSIDGWCWRLFPREGPQYQINPNIDPRAAKQANREHPDANYVDFLTAKSLCQALLHPT